MLGYAKHRLAPRRLGFNFLVLLPRSSIVGRAPSPMFKRALLFGTREEKRWGVGKETVTKRRKHRWCGAIQGSREKTGKEERLPEGDFSLIGSKRKKNGRKRFREGAAADTHKTGQ